MFLSPIIFSLTADTKMDIKTIAGQVIYLVCISSSFNMALPPDFLLSD